MVQKHLVSVSLNWLRPLLLHLQCWFYFDFAVEFSVLQWIVLHKARIHFFRLHAWGDTLEEAFEQCAMAMFGYMTDTGTVEPLQTIEVETQGNQFVHKEDIVIQVFRCYIISVYTYRRYNKVDYELVLSTSLRNLLHCKILTSFQRWELLNTILYASFWPCVGDDLQSLLFHFLDEWLYKFSADEFFIPRVSKFFFFTEQMHFEFIF